jgi:hypothetical protein
LEFASTTEQNTSMALSVAHFKTPRAVAAATDANFSWMDATHW